MKTAIEAVISAFIITICVFICANIIGANLDATQAQNAYTTYCSQIQDSNCADSVVSSCISDAEAKGYKLTVNVTQDDYGNRFADVIMAYDYDIKVLGVDEVIFLRGHVS